METKDKVTSTFAQHGVPLPTFISTKEQAAISEIKSESV